MEGSLKIDLDKVMTSGNGIFIIGIAWLLFWLGPLSVELKENIISRYGKELYQAADIGLNKWVKGADEGKVGRSRLIGKKM
jgi:hypothetical protein